MAMYDDKRKSLTELIPLVKKKKFIAVIVP